MKAYLCTIKVYDKFITFKHDLQYNFYTSSSTFTIMESQQDVFKKPEEPRPKTPTFKRAPEDEVNCERPSKVSKKPSKMMAILMEKQNTSFLGNMVALHDARSPPDVFWWEGDILVPASYNNSKFLMVEDTCFPPHYTPVEKQARLVDWGKFAVKYNPYLKLNCLDDQTVEVVLVRQSIHVVPHERLTLAFMDARFPQVIELLKRSYEPSKHFEGKTLKLITHPFNKINDGYSKDPYMLSKEYVIGMIKYLIENGLIMVERPELGIDQHTVENGRNFYSVTIKGRKMLCEGIGRIVKFNCSKKREHYKLFISKFFTGRGWNDSCINPNCTNIVIRDNEYASLHELGIDREKALNKGFYICGKCARYNFFDQKANSALCYDEEQDEESLEGI